MRSNGYRLRSTNPIVIQSVSEETPKKDNNFPKFSLNYSLVKETLLIVYFLLKFFYG